MKRLRLRAKFSSWLALFALALQLALSFGHVHLDSAGNAPTKALAAAPSPASPNSPPAHPAGDADDYCAICATIHLAAASDLPQVAQLPVLFVAHPVEHPDRVTTIFVAPRRAFFQSRAPPLA
jgi:hypothetical protein